LSSTQGFLNIYKPFQNCAEG